MDDTDRDLARCDEITRSSLLLVVGTALQMVLLILAFLVILAVPAMLNDVAESAQSVIGVATWMNWLACFVASLSSMYIIRRRFWSAAILAAQSSLYRVELVDSLCFVCNICAPMSSGEQ